MSDDNCVEGVPGEQGGLIREILIRLVRARRRMAVIEGNEPSSGALRWIAAIAGLQRFVDDDHPGVADLQSQFWNGLERDVDAIRFRLDRFEKISAAVRRQFTVIDGGLS